MGWAMHRNTGTKHEESRNEGYACKRYGHPKNYEVREQTYSTPRMHEPPTLHRTRGICPAKRTSQQQHQHPTTHRTCDSYCLANCRAALRNEPSVPAAPPPWPPWPGCAQQALHTRRCTECSAPVPPQSCVCVWAPASCVCASTDLVVAAPGSTEKDRALMSVTDMVAPLDLPDLLKAAANNNAK